MLLYAKFQQKIGANMPKSIEYARRSLTDSMKLAGAVDALGGASSEEMCAQKMGKKLSGSFSALMSSAIKYSLIDKTKGQLTTTDLFRDYKLAYNDQEKLQALRNAFLNVPVFSEIVERFKGKKLPIDIFDKLLIKEFNVDQNSASRVAKYFIEGVRTIGLLGENGIIEDNTSETIGEMSRDVKAEASSNNFSDSKTDFREPKIELHNTENYTIHIKGPNIDSLIEMIDEEDFDIVAATLKKVKKRFDNITEPKLDQNGE